MEMRDFEERRLDRWGNTPGSYADDRELALSAAFPALMRKVYLWMTLALAITAITAYGVATSPALLSLIYSSKWTFFGLIIAELALVIYVSARINSLSLTTATMLFILYSVINGATLAMIFAVYSMSVIGQTFLVTAGTFGVMAVYGYFTKKDLTSWGRLLFMALIGLIIAGIVNMFLHNSTMDLIVSGIGVLVFVGLTAYDSQKIKMMLLAQEDMGETAQKVALMGALSLYLDFINLFLYLLRFMGRNR
ncbi:MAG: Bax inhibitor-1/YccA family protein [Prevotella sp.]|nr:Bax inhibitor-1/YccA family protein [Prevotella sp.]